MKRKTKLLHEVRAVKNRRELTYITQAQRIGERVLDQVLGELHTGITEIEVADRIKILFAEHGAPILSFPPIVAFGKNTANIHHEPGRTKLKEGHTIMFDFGCTVAHYCSDMTRTYFWGKSTQRQRKIYSDVLQAQEMAITKLQRGERRAKVIDASARKFLNKKYGAKKFPHGLGHGVGTVIHEWPNFKPKSPDILPVGCVMTVEPGLYIPGVGGVRIEDMLVITKNGCKNLTRPPKDLGSIVLQSHK